MLSKMRAQTVSLVCNFVLAMSLVTLVSLVSGSEIEAAIPSKILRDIRTFEQERLGTCSQQGLKWRSRRLLQDSMDDRPAPRGFPPPAGNALVHPQRAPPRFDSFENTKQGAWIPPNPPPPKLPPPHP